MGFGYVELVAGLKMCAEELGIEKVTPYQRRHSGATIDASKKWRSLAEIQKRGSWSQKQSMHRYEHSSRLAHDYAKHDHEKKQIFEKAENHLKDILFNRRHPLTDMASARRSRKEVREVRNTRPLMGA